MDAQRREKLGRIVRQALAGGAKPAFDELVEREKEIYRAAGEAVCLEMLKELIGKVDELRTLKREAELETTGT